MSRLTQLKVDSLTAEQHEVFAAVTGGKRSLNRPLSEFLTPQGALRGPFNSMLHSPQLGLVVQRLGEMLRFEGELSDRCREMAILVVGAHWKSHYEWWAHARIARRVGTADEVLEALAQGEMPQLDDPIERAVLAFAREAVQGHRVCDETYQQAKSVLGEPMLVELTILLGYYGMISMLLNSFAVPLPEGASAPFDANEKAAGES
jgi:4-carboxymuconolactone decarboxylase